MKRNIFLLVISLIFQIAFCQDIRIKPSYYIEKSRVYKSTDFFLKLYYDIGKYQIIQSKELEDKIISEGKIDVRKGVIVFKNDKAKYSFKMKLIDRYKLFSLNKTIFFDKSEIIYLISIDSNEGPIEHMSWKAGRRDGYWTINSPKGVTTIIYENGLFKESHFESWNEIRLKTPEL